MCYVVLKLDVSVLARRIDVLGRHRVVESGRVRVVAVLMVVEGC